MQAVGIPSGTLTKEETWELGKLLLKAEYAVKVGKKELKSGKKLKCYFMELLKKWRNKQ